MSGTKKQHTKKQTAMSESAEKQHLNPQEFQTLELSSTDYLNNYNYVLKV